MDPHWFGFLDPDPHWNNKLYSDPPLKPIRMHNTVSTSNSTSSPRPGPSWCCWPTPPAGWASSGGAATPRYPDSPRLKSPGRPPLGIDVEESGYCCCTQEPRMNPPAEEKSFYVSEAFLMRYRCWFLNCSVQRPVWMGGKPSTQSFFTYSQNTEHWIMSTKYRIQKLMYITLPMYGVPVFFIWRLDLD